MTPQPPPDTAPSLWSKFGSGLQFGLALAVTLACLAWLLWGPQATPPEAPAPEGVSINEVVSVTGPRLITMLPGTAFDNKLATLTLKLKTISNPILTVTGRVVASLRPGGSERDDYWQFDAPEVLTSFTDWRKAEADIVFAKKQLGSIKELAEARVESQKKVVARLEKLVKAGSDSPKDLAVETTNLMQYRILGRKEVHEGETAVRVAQRSEAAAARQLEQAGLETGLLRKATSDIDLVMADVPETKIKRVTVGLTVRAEFFGVPGKKFGGKVKSIAPVLSRERRSLRVLFEVDDFDDDLRPGMFAEIGIGTNPRRTLLLPADAVLHVGRSDYVLVSTVRPRVWRIVEVRLGELYGKSLEVLSDLRPGQRVLTRGAVLLKPVVIAALQPEDDR